MGARRPILAWWTVPATVPPSTPVYTLGPALLLGVGAFLVCAVGGMLALWHTLDGVLPWNNGCGHWCWHPGPWEVVSYLPRDPWDQPWVVYSRTVPGAVLGLIVGVWLFWLEFKPRPALRHVSGPELLDGKDAVKACRDIADGAECLRLHPCLPLQREAWTQGVLVAGAVGAGKTQIIEPVVEQAIRAGVKSLVLDTKGDYTAHFPAGAILSPWDARTRYWDIAADVQTVAEAQAFAAALVPPGHGENQHWNESSRAILVGVLVALQRTYGTGWGWRTLANALAAGHQVLREMLHEFYPEAVALLGDGSPHGTTTASAMASLAGHTQVVSNLARAWGDGDVPGRRGKMKRLSLRAWAADGYEGRRTILLHAGADAALSRAWLSAAYAIAGQALLALPDSRRRIVFIVLDEMTAVRLHLDGLMERGRSKGLCCILGVQDLAQVAAIYGEHQAATLPAMLGTQIICRVSPGATREKIARWLGQRRVWVPAMTQSSSSHGQSVSSAAHEEMRAVVEPTELSELGARATRNGFVVDAILAREGYVLRLSWPGRVWLKKRRGHVPARWTIPDDGAAASPRVRWRVA